MLKVGGGAERIGLIKLRSQIVGVITVVVAAANQRQAGGADRGAPRTPKQRAPPEASSPERGIGVSHSVFPSLVPVPARNRIRVTGNRQARKFRPNPDR